MLCPEIWDFKAPCHRFEIERTNYSREGEIPATVRTHYFNHSVSIVLPATNDIPDELRNCFTEDSDYYKVTNLRIHELVDRQFIEAFVKKGEVSLLAIGKKIDTDNSICVTPTGHLVLSLLREDYQKLGLVGKETFFDRKEHSRFVVTIDLKEEAFVPGKKNYERARSCLRENFVETFDVILVWDPPEEKLCPSSIAAWFHARGYATALCNQLFLERIERSVLVPKLDRTCSLDDFFEWLGIFSINGDTESGEDDYVNSYKCEMPKVRVSAVRHVQCTGLLSRKHITRIYESMRDLSLAESTKSWTSLDVQGFSDSPISWDLKEHNFFIDGDNSLTIVFQTNGDSVVRKSLSSNKKPRIFQ